MYWVKIKRLKHELSEGIFTERDAVPYIIAQGVLVALIPLAETSHSAFEFVSAAFSILILVLGTWYVFKKHNPDSASSFLSKYISLSWVVGLRCFLVFIPIMILFSIPVVFFGSELVKGIAPVVWAIIFSLIYYFRLGRNISET